MSKRRSDLRRLRILAIGELEVKGYEHADAIWIDAPLTD
jgi:hypothetical protein